MESSLSSASASEVSMLTARLMDDTEVQVHLLRLIGDLEAGAVPDAAAWERR